MYLDDLRKRVAEREAQVSTTKTATASPSANYLDDLRNRTAEREASLAGKTTKLREEYKSNPVSVSGGSSNAPATNRFYGADPKTVDIGALDAEIEKNRKAREKALSDYDAAYAANYSNMQGVVDNRSWEEKYAERSAVTESYEKDIAALHELRELANSVQYQAAGEKALSELDADTLEILDNILAGVPQNTEAPMQGIADNRSWEEVYAENEAYMDVFRQAMRDKGYTPEETEQLADYRQRQQNKVLYDLAVQKAVEEAESGVGGAISASLKSVPQNLTGGLGYLAAVSHTAHNKLTGKDRPLDVYAPEFVGSAAAKAARESVSRQLEENTNWETKLTGNVASFLYNTGMSAADSAAAGVIGRVLAVPTAGITTDAAKKFASNAAGVVLGSSVATSALVEAKERGVSDEKALITGLAFGAAEGFFEKHSIDRWFGNKAVKGLLRDRVKQTLKNTGAQVITEGTEELATSIADTIADSIINGNLSDLNTRIRAYIRDGYTEKEAREKVSGEWWNSLAQDFLAGAISGGVMGGVSTGINTLIESKDINDVYGDSAQELVAETLELDPENKTAQKAQAQLDEGKKLNPTVIRSLLLDNREYIEREEAANPTPEDTVEQEERVALTRPEDMTEEEAADIIEQASVDFGEAAGVFKSAYSATQDPYQYASAAKVAYAAGRTMGAKAMQYAANSKNTIGLEGWQIEKLVEEGRQAIAKEIKTVSPVKGKGKLVIPNTIKSELLTNKQNTDIRVLDALAKITGYTVELYESTINENGEYVGENGSYSPEEGVIRIDINAGKNRVDDIAEYALVRTMSHELTHSFQKNAPAEYQKLRELVLDIIAEEGKTLDDLVSYKKARAIKGDLTDEQAFDEVVADACEMLLRDSNAVQRLVNKDRNLAQRVFDWIKQFFADLAKAFNGVSAAHQEALIIEKRKEEVLALWDSAFEMSMSNLSTAKEASTDFVAVEDTTNYSFRSLAEAAGFSAMELEDGRKVFLRNGEVVNNVTVEDIDNSPIGALINASLKEVDGKVVWKFGISESDAQAQKEMFAKLCNIAINTTDFNMAMQFAGSTVFTAMKANSDKQYKTTYDFPSICTKTQAVIDQMSTAMVSLGRGLTDKEILKLYDKVHFNGLPVPCPECYVFSRWIGIGGLLDNIKKYQTKYGDMTPAEVAKAYDDIKEKVEQKVAESGGKLSSGKAKGKLHSELQKKYNDALERVQKAENQGGTPTQKDLDTVAEIEPLLTDIKAMSWIDTVYFTDPSHKTRRKNWEVPDDVLFDLNKGEIFASQYKAAWAFRTTQGAGYGKAITPYAEAVIGEGILVNNNTTKTIKQKAAGVLNNPFLTQRGKLDKPTASMLKTARAKQLAQAFLGGQRFQSTSDARYENASDYLIAMLELQAMGGMAQVYTKVDGAVPAFAAWGMAINQSLMPRGGGLVDGKIVDTPVGGMKPSVAFDNRKKFDTAGTITIGVNDNHIRAMFYEWVRDFIIPYHASGGRASTVAEMRRIQEGADGGKTNIRSTDYTRTQSEKVLSNEVLRWMGKTPEEIKLIEDRRKARLDLLSGKKADMDVVRGSTYLTELHRRLNEEWKGVKIAKSTVESHIFPNEFWDESVDYDHSAKIVEDYLAYCEELGFLHRFSGLIPHKGQLRPAKGYDENGNRVELTDLAYQYDENGNKTDVVEPFFWKVLTDRRMYGNDKKYLPQQRVKLDTDPETTANFAKVNDGRSYDKSKSVEMSEELKARIEAAKLYSERDYGILSDRGFGIPSNRTLIVRYEANEHDSKGLLESVERYKGKAEELKKAQSDLRYLRKKLEKTPETDSKKYREVLDSATRAKNRVEAITAEMNRIESGKAMQELISRELKVVSVSRAEAAKRVAKYRERLNATETRRKLRDKITYRVKTLDKMLRNPTDAKHIPDGLQKTIFDFCELFTEEKGVWYGDRLASVKARYEELKPKAASEFSEFSVMDLYDESIPDMLQYLTEHLNGKRLAELTRSELEMVLNIADHFAFMVKNENEIFYGNRKADLAETVKNLFEEAGENSVTEYVVGNDTVNVRVNGGIIADKHLKPIYFFRNKGNTLKTLFDGMLKAQREYALKMDAAKAFVEKTKEDTDYDEWFDPDAKLVMENDAGQRIELTIQQAMSLVATYEREVRSGESYHTTQGGFIYAGEILEDVTTKSGKKVHGVKKVNAKETYEAHPMSVTDMAKVVGWLREISPNTIAYVEKMVDYLSSDLADIGNDVCKKLFGYKKFWDEFYFPIKSSSDFLKTEPGQIGKDDSRWKHKGFTKRRIPNANNAFVLDDFDSVWKTHTSEMLMFATMAIPQDSFVRVLNYKTAVDKEGLTPSRSTKNVIETAYGDSALEYIDTLLRDVNGGVAADPREGEYGKWLSIFKKGATALSASVAIQQPSALVRALMHIDLKYIRKGMANPNFDEALKHSGLAVLKTIGGYDTTTGKAGADWLMAKTPNGIGNKVKAALTFGKNDTGYRDELLYLLPQKMDELSWGILWSAAKAEVEETTDLEKGSDAYWDAVTDRFDEIIELTQVYDSVLTRSANMRAKSLAMKAFTAFGAEPTTTLNIAVAALQDFVAKKPNAKKNLAKATVVLLASIVVNSMLKAIVTAPRDDDESKTLPEKYIEKVISGIVSDVNPMSYFPYLRGIASVFEGFTVEDKFIAPIADFIKAMQKAADERSWENILDATLQATTLIGVPLENLWRDIKGVYNAFFKTAHLRESSWKGAADAVKEGLGIDDPTIKESAIDALRWDEKGNERKRKKALDEITSVYNDKVKKYRLEGVDPKEADKKAKTAIRSQITQALKPLYIAAETTAEKNRIIALARRVYIGGEQLYKDYNFAKNWAADE